MTAKELYSEFFGLTERPFMLTPDPSFLFWSKHHKRAYSVLEFGIMARAPITLLTGEIGSGKTTLLQHLLANVDENVTIGLVSNAQGGRGELLQWILNSLSIRTADDTSYVSMFQTLQEFLISEYSAGQRVVLIFDEAQNLSIEGLEELRMLTNINSNKDDLVQLILVGQPELRDMVTSPGMRQLAQRVAASYHLKEMGEETVCEYIRHRLRSCGGTGEEFSEKACRAIHKASSGVPRLVNQLCEFALLYAWSLEKKVIDEDIIKSVLDDGVTFAVHTREPDAVFKKSGAAE